MERQSQLPAGRMTNEPTLLDMALEAADAGNAGHWPTVAEILAQECRRLNPALTRKRQSPCTQAAPSSPVEPPEKSQQPPEERKT